MPWRGAPARSDSQPVCHQYLNDCQTQAVIPVQSAEAGPSVKAIRRSPCKLMPLLAVYTASKAAVNAFRVAGAGAPCF